MKIKMLHVEGMFKVCWYSACMGSVVGTSRWITDYTT